MGFYEEQILPRVTDRALRGKQAARLRARVTAGLSGEVLEVGFGSGLNMPYYPPAVRRVRAVDPSAVARKLAAERVAASTVPVEYIGVDAQALPLEDASVDHVVSVLTLCTIPAVDRALAEIRRVLRPGGIAVLGYPRVDRLMAALFRAIGFHGIEDNHVSGPAAIETAIGRVLALERRRPWPRAPLPLYYVSRWRRDGGPATTPRAT